MAIGNSVAGRVPILVNGMVITFFISYFALSSPVCLSEETIGKRASQDTPLASNDPVAFIQLAEKLVQAEISARHKYLKQGNAFVHVAACTAVAGDMGIPAARFVKEFPKAACKLPADSTLYHQGCVKFAANDYEAAEELAIRAAGKASTPAEAVKALELAGCSAAALEKFDRAFDHLSRASKRFSYDENPLQWEALEWQMADLLSLQGNNREAAEKYRSLIEIYRQKLGPESSETLALRNSFAETLFARGRRVEAKNEFESVIANRNTSLGESDPDTLLSRNSLASVLAASGKSQEAERELNEAAAQAGHSSSGTHLARMIIRCNLGYQLWTMGRFKDAEAQFRAILPNYEELFGEKSSNTLLIKNNLALMLCEQGHYAEAEKSHREVLLVQEQLLGPDSPETLA